MIEHSLVLDTSDFQDILIHEVDEFQRRIRVIQADLVQLNPQDVGNIIVKVKNARLVEGLQG